MKIKNRTDLTLFEAASIIIGHGIGAGIFSVPYLASYNSFRTAVLIIVFCAVFNIILHLLIAELSLNNGGAQFVSCFENELFSGKLGKIFTWIAFVLMGLSVVVNVSAYLTGAAAVFQSWFGLNDWLGMLLFYILCTAVVFVGIKLVGICEKFAVAAMVLVVCILFAATVKGSVFPLPSERRSLGNAVALFGIVSFSLSAVMSTPQVVKGLGGDRKKIKGAIAAGIAVNAAIIMFVTVTTLLGAGNDISEDGAIVDLARHLGGWVSIIGYVFTLLALATSFWANTLNLRDIIYEQLRWKRNLCWAAGSLPPLIFALFASASFVKLSRMAGIILVITSLGIILAYNRSRKRTGRSELLGRLGELPFQILVVCCSMVATIGAVIQVG